MVAAPSGTVTFLFTDIQGSTRLWQDEPEAMEIALKRHDEILHKAVSQNNGHVFKTVGDAFCCAFGDALDAVRAGISIQLILREEVWATPRPIRVRMSLHTGAARERDADYFGPTVNRVARIESLAHGGQVIMSRSTAELVRDQLPDGISLAEKGSHRLKDLSRPEEIFQVCHTDLPSDFPPLRSMDVLPNNLPVQTTQLIGREAEMENVKNMFLRDGCRLVSLIGPGGMGKTRMALQLAADLVDRNRDGTWLVDLTEVGRPEGVALETALVLGIPLKPGIPPVELVAEVLKDKELLLILDNFEQVMSAYEVVVTWLKRAPGVRFLVTSREALNIRGEQVFHVPPLSLPKKGVPGVLSQYESTRMFIDRACAGQPDFVVNNENAPVVAEICARLDGIPLAIELAAARIRMMDPQAILKRLETRLKLLTGGPNDMPERHKTLRACIDWSYDLLGDRERIIYRHLSVFSGSIPLDGAVKVLFPVIEDDLEVLDGVESLVDKSLLFRLEPLADEPYFGMLETIVEYGRERLAESGEEQETLDRYSDFFEELVKDARVGWDGPDQKTWIDKISRSQDNIRHVMNRFVKKGDGSTVVALTRSMVPFWIMRSDFNTCRNWIWASLEYCSGPDCRNWAWLTFYMGWLSWSAGNHDDAEHYLEQALPGFQRNTDMEGSAECLRHLAYVMYLKGDMKKAEAYCTDAAEAASACSDSDLDARINHTLGNIYLKSGRFEEAIARLVLAQKTYTRAGNPRKIAEANNNIGAVHQLQGNFAEAKIWYERALPILEELEHFNYLRYTWSNLGELALEGKDFRTALTMFEKVKNLAVSTLDHRYTSSSFSGIAQSYIGLGDFELAEFCAHEAVDLVKQYGDSVELGVACRVIGDLHRLKGEPEDARFFYNDAERILTPLLEDDEIGKIAAGRNLLADVGGMYG